jgi:hypothetical protein
MANMSYCRFQNTLNNLLDCYEHIDNEELSEEEEKARKRLIDICTQIAEEFNEEE